MVVTWELHFAAPRSPEAKASWLETLERIKSDVTELLMDIYDDETAISVMVADIGTFNRVMCAATHNFQLPTQMSASFDFGEGNGKVWLCNSGDDAEIEFPSAT